MELKDDFLNSKSFSSSNHGSRLRLVSKKHRFPMSNLKQVLFSCCLLMSSGIPNAQSYSVVRLAANSFSFFFSVLPEFCFSTSADDTSMALLRNPVLFGVRM